MKKILFLLGLAIVLFVPSAVRAANPQCTGAGGDCYRPSVCNNYKISNPGTADLGPKDCQDPSDQNWTCCKIKQITCTSLGGSCRQGCADFSQGFGPLDCGAAKTCCPELKAAATSCQDNGGHCASDCFGNEKNIGDFDCKNNGSLDVCCKVPTTAPAPPSGTAGTKPSVASAGGGTVGGVVSGAIQLPDCIQSGDCSVNDIVQTGVNFATFLMGLSGALFFMIFIYGGALYLTSFGEKSKVEKGRKAIIGAAIGIVIVMGAWTMVQYIVKGITGVGSGGSGGSGGGGTTTGQTGTPNDCSTAFPGYSCMTFSNAKNKADLLAKCQAANDCKPEHCSGPLDMCAKSKT